MLSHVYFVLGRLEQPRQGKNILNRHDSPNEPTKEGPFSFALFESPSVSTVSRGHPSGHESEFLLENAAQNLHYLPGRERPTYMPWTETFYGKLVVIRNRNNLGQDK
jgi:hypothetical protein